MIWTSSEPQSSMVWTADGPEPGSSAVLSRIGSRFTFANITATLALVFAMSGGALAANHYLLTSTRQVSPRVLSALKGKTGPAGKVGAVGSAGAQGPEGKAGANGVGVTSRAFEGAAGSCTQGGSEFTAANGTTFACNGTNGREPKEPKEPKEGSPGPPTRFRPAGPRQARGPSRPGLEIRSLRSRSRSRWPQHSAKWMCTTSKKGKWDNMPRRSWKTDSRTGQPLRLSGLY